MAGRILRGAVVGASSLLGKELAEELSKATAVVWDLTLLDAEEAGGQMTAAGEEAMVIQPISAEAFSGIDVAFFAGEAATTLAFWKNAHEAGASIVDLTGALEGQPQVLVRAAGMKGGTAANLATVALVPAHPVAVMLGMLQARLQAFGLTRMAATVMRPASECGSAGVEELHQQTVGLLAFKPLKKDVYDTQVAFNLVSSLGEAAKVSLETVRATIHRQLGSLLGGEGADRIVLQLIEAPVFHGYTASVFLEFGSGVEAETVRAALHGEGLDVVEEPSPSNESAAGKDEVVVSVSAAASREGSCLWVWMAADNLRIAATNAVACATELAPLRPADGVH